MHPCSIPGGGLAPTRIRGVRLLDLLKDRCRKPDDVESTSWYNPSVSKLQCNSDTSYQRVDSTSSDFRELSLGGGWGGRAGFSVESNSGLGSRRTISSFVFLNAVTNSEAALKREDCILIFRIAAIPGRIGSGGDIRICVRNAS